MDEGDWDAVVREKNAEIVRLQDEVDKLRAEVDRLRVIRPVIMRAEAKHLGIITIDTEQTAERK